MPTDDLKNEAQDELKEGLEVQDEGFEEATLESTGSGAEGADQGAKTAPSPWSALNWGKEKGIDTAQFKTDQDLVESIADRLNHFYGQSSTLYQQNMQLQQQLEALQKAQKAAAQPKTEEKPKFQEWEKLPKYDESWLYQSNLDPVSQQGLNAYRQALQKRLHGIADDPYQALSPVYQRWQTEIMDAVQKKISDAIGGFRKEYEADQYATLVAPHVYDQQGNIKPEGYVFMQNMYQGRNLGLTGEALSLFAEARTQADIYGQQLKQYMGQPAGQDEETQATGKRDEFIKKNSRNPSRNGKQPRSGSDDPVDNYDERFMRELEEALNG